MERLTEFSAFAANSVGENEFIVLTGFSIAVAAGVLLYYAQLGLRKLGRVLKKIRGRIQMKTREKRRALMREIVEDCFVDGISNALELKKITDDEARIMYAQFARMGFFGLFYRKFNRRKTQEELDALKLKLQAAQAARKAKKSDGPKVEPTLSSLVDKMTAGVEEELG